MIQNNRYCKAKQAAVIADATRKCQRCNQRDPAGTSAVIHTT
ncbi:MAG: hypothetical protein V8T38_14505 [Oscillospiraceae bacterium]